MKTKKIIHLLLILIFILFIVSLYNRIMHIDDAWLGEYAYQFSKYNYLKSDMLANWANYGNKLLIYHKLFIITGSVFIKIFGFSLYVLKSISFLFLIIFFITIYFFLKKNYGINLKKYLLFCGLYISVPIVIEHSFIYRPETMLMSFGFLSFYFLHTFIKTGSKKALLLSAILTGLAVLVHLNGMIYLIANILMILIFKRKIKHLAVFIFISLSICLLYLFDFKNISDLKLFVYQFKNDPAISEKDISIYYKLKKIIDFHKIFFHSAQSSFFSALFFVTLILGGKIYFKNINDKIIYFYTLILVFSLALIMRGRPIHYMILYMPFLLLIIFRLITQDYLLSTTKQKILGLFVFLHLFYSIVYTISLINKNYKITIEEQNRLICQDIPIGKKITCPITFIYNEVKNYQIEGLIYYDIIEKKKNIKYSIDELFLEISRNGSEYIIINEPLKYNIEKLKCGDKIADFELFAIKSNSYIFKKTALIL